MLISLYIIILLKIMDIAVDFNYQGFRVAIEVNNVTIYDLLATELQPIQAIMSQLLPENAFC